MSTTATGGGFPLVRKDGRPYAAAPDLPAILPTPKQRGRITGFIYRNPTITVGGSLVVIMILIAIR